MSSILQTFTATWSLMILLVVVFLLSRPFSFLRRSLRLLIVLNLFVGIRESFPYFYRQPSVPVLKCFDLGLIILTISTILSFIKDFTNQLLIRRGIKISRLIWDVFTVIVYTLSILLYLKTSFGVDITPLLATSAVLTVVLGLAVQDTLGNLVAGMVLHFEDSIQLGEWLEMDNVVGEVRDLTWRAVRVVTSTQNIHVFPNQDFTRKKFQNLSRLGAAQAFDVGASYEDDPGLVMDVILRAVLSTPGVRWQPRPDVLLKEFADFSVIYTIRFYLQNYRDLSVVRSHIHRSIWYAFKQHGIRIPFPVRDLIMRPAEIKTDMESGGGLQVRAALSGIELFSYFNDYELDSIAKFSRLLTYSPGGVIALEGEQGHSMFIILQGQVKVHKDQRMVAELGKQDVFGEISLFTGEPRGASVTALTPVTLLRVDKAGFDSILKENQDFIGKIEKMIQARLNAKAASGELAGADINRGILKRIRTFLLGQ